MRHSARRALAELGGWTYHVRVAALFDSAGMGSGQLRWQVQARSEQSAGLAEADLPGLAEFDCASIPPGLFLYSMWLEVGISGFPFPLSFAHLIRLVVVSEASVGLWVIEESCLPLASLRRR